MAPLHGDGNKIAISMEITKYRSGIVTVRNFLNSIECEDYIHLSETIGYELATINTIYGAEVNENVRNNDRVILDELTIADDLFVRAKAFLPQERYGWQLKGLNERWRFYRYRDEQFFKWHVDGYFRRTENEVSLLTFMIYLNDDFIGGETQFRWEWITPETGMALVFPHRMIHQGAPLFSGAKYVLRSDVMYQKPTD